MEARVQLLGGLQVAIDGRRVDGDLPGRQGRALAMFLLLRPGRAVTREELVEALWPDGTAPPAAREALSALLSRLRRALAPIVLEGRSEIVLRLPDGADSDLDRARADLAGARDAAVVYGDHELAIALAERAAAAAARGLVLDHPAEWVEALRREVEEVELEARTIEAGSALELGGPQLGRAEAAARLLAARSPFSEEAARLLMRALAARGELAEALRAYDELRRLLRDELATAPSEALRAEHARLLAEAFAPARRPGTGAEPPPPFAPRALLAPPRGPFVGRVAEREHLAAAWERANRGSLRVALIGGEPGVGKTRLAEEAARAAHAGGATVLLGRASAVPLGAYQLWLEALGPWTEAAPPELLRAMVARDLSRLLPELAARLGAAPASVGGGETGLGRLRVLDAAARTLRTLAERDGLLVVLDDLQWADEASLELLRHLVRGPKDVRLLVLATVRDDESGKLLDVAADLAREGVGERIALDGLAEHEVAELVRALSGEAAPPRLARHLHETTGGNPFFVSELVRAGPARRLPAGVRDVIAQRLARVSSALALTLRAAAVIGDEAPVALLEAVTGLDPDALLDALEEGVAATVLVERPGPDGAYAFTHSLLRTAIEQEMSALRRARLHRKVLAALEAQGTPPEPAEVARHALAGADAERAVAWSVRAAQAAEARAAYDDAATHYRRARGVVPPAARDRRLVLELAEGEAALRAGRKAAARERFATAAALARELGDADALARAALGFAGRESEGFGTVDDAAVILLREALDVLPDTDSIARAEALARLGGAVYFGAPREASEGRSAEGLAMARRLEAPGPLATILAQRHYTLWRPDRLEERLAISAELLELASSLGDRELECQSWSLRVIDLMEVGDVVGAEAAIAAHRGLAHGLRQPHFLLYAAVLRAMTALLHGELEQAERLAYDALTIGQRDQDPDTLQFFGVLLFALRAEQGRLPELEEPVRAFVDQYPAVPCWRAALGLVLAEAGRADAARTELAALGPTGEALPLDVNWLPAMALLGQAAATVDDDPVRTNAIHERLAPYAGRSVMLGALGAYWGSVDHHLGTIAAAAGRSELAREHFVRAREAHEAAGARLWVARTEIASRVAAPSRR